MAPPDTGTRSPSSPATWLCISLWRAYKINGLAPLTHRIELNVESLARVAAAHLGARPGRCGSRPLPEKARGLSREGYWTVKTGQALEPSPGGAGVSW